MNTTTRANPYIPTNAPLPPITVSGRLDRLRSAFGEHEVDALVVTTLANVRYLTGFAGSAGVLTVTRERALLTTDGRYRTQSAEQVEKAGADALQLYLSAIGGNFDAIDEQVGLLREALDTRRKLLRELHEQVFDDET